MNTWLAYSARTGIAAATSWGVARLFEMPEDYWAPITTLVVMQSTVGEAWEISKKRLIGSALGVSLGALLTSYMNPSIIVFATAIFALGIICAILRLDQYAYRFAGIALTIVLLIARNHSPWITGLHRFIEVSIGIGVGLVFNIIWPVQLPKSGSIS